MKQKIKNIFKKPTKKSLGKLGLFLVGLFFIFNINLDSFSSDSSFLSVSLTIVEAKSVLDGLDDKQLSASGLKRNSDGSYDLNKSIGSQVLGGAATAATNWTLDGLDGMIRGLVEAMGKQIDVVLSQKFFDALVKNDKNPGIYKGWVIVRDLTNMFFMILLLFSAFATIFQVEKYHLRKMIIMLVVMALLVNFSFPIASFVIDFSNSIMYFILDRTFTKQSVSAEIADFSQYGAIIKAANELELATVSAHLMVLVMDFFVLVTFIAIWINLLIRILAFMVLIILSPIGFTFAFFPDTKNMANDWWSTLFKYAFFGPVMAFFLYLAMMIFQSSTGGVVNKLNFAGTLIVFSVPIVFLWMGLTISLKMGGAGSGIAMNMAKRTGNKIRGYGQTLAWGGVKLGGRGVDTMTGHRISGGIGAIKSRWSQFGDDYKSRSESRSAQFGSTIGVRGAKEKDMKRRAEEYKKNNAEENELKNLAKRGDAAAAYRLAEDKNMDQETYDKFMEINRDNSLRKAINSKTKQTRMDLVAVNVAETTINSSTELDKFKEKNPVAKGMTNDQIRSLIINQEMGKLSAEDYSNQDWKAASERVNSLIAEGRTNDANNIKNAVSDAFKNLPSSAKNEMAKRLNGQKAAILKDDFNVITL